MVPLMNRRVYMYKSSPYEIYFFFFKDFIYLFDRERERQPAREGTQAGGVGEEKAGSRQRSPMRDSFPECCDHALIRRQALNDCATQVPRVVGFLIFHPAFWVTGLLAGTQETLFG